MIRVRLTDPETRGPIAASLRFSNLVVTFPAREDTLYVDFAAFNLDENVQLRIVRLVLDMWHREHRDAGDAITEVTIVDAEEVKSSS